MSFLRPGSRSASTKTAKTLLAWAADLQQVVTLLENAGEKYQHGIADEATAYGVLAAPLTIRMVLNSHSNATKKDTP
jgi:hypothetical protein